MKAIRYILTNPLGWALAVVHWLVVVFAFLGDAPSDPPGFGVHSTTGLMFYLSVLDLPGLLITRLLLGSFEPLYFLTPMNAIIPIGLITLQWLLVGSAAARLFSDYRSTTPIDGDGQPPLNDLPQEPTIHHITVTEIRSLNRSTL